MKHRFYKYTINLDYYQSREIPQEIVPYEERFEGSLLTAIQKFQKELHWDAMWTLSDVKKRLQEGWKFWVLRPKNQIRGWIWLSPDGEMVNVYVSKYLRNRNWCKQLTYQCLNEAVEMGLPSVYARIDIWNEVSKKSLESLLEVIACRTGVEMVEEEYNH